MIQRSALGLLCLLVTALPLPAAHAQGGPPTVLSADPYSRAVVCAAHLALSVQATRGQDATVAARMEDGMGRWLLRAVDLAPKAGRTVEQMNSAVKFNLEMLRALIGNPQDREQVLQNVSVCSKEAAGLPAK